METLSRSQKIDEISSYLLKYHKSKYIMIFNNNNYNNNRQTARKYEFNIRRKGPVVW